MAEAKTKSVVITLTADDERPVCFKCDNQYDMSEESCSKMCGPAKGWSLYRHTECVTILSE